jgi:hypothetical protein
MQSLLYECAWLFFESKAVPFHKLTQQVILSPKSLRKDHPFSLLPQVLATRFKL